MSGSVQGAPTATQLIASGAAAIEPITLGYYPGEGSKGATAIYNWTAAAGYADDLSRLVSMGMATTPQGAFIDNASNPAAVTLTVAGTGQTVTVPGYAQAIVPLFFTGAPQLAVVSTTASGAFTRITYVNVPVSASVWGAQSSAFDTQGDLKTALYVANSTNQIGIANGNTNGGIIPGGGNVTSAAPSYTAGFPGELSLDTAGSLRVSLLGPAGGNGGPVWSGGLGNGNNVSGINTAALCHTSPAALTTGSVGQIIQDQRGSLWVNTETNNPVYSASGQFTAQAGATDIFTLSGSGSKTIRLHQIMLSAASAVTVQAFTRTTADTGGTFIGLAAGPHDTNNAAVTASAGIYTANPATLGTQGAQIETFTLPANTPMVLTYGSTDQSIVLRGAAQFYCLNLGTLNGASVVVNVKAKWSEV